jgi:AraC family transcriptional regulator of adaptative response / DNA-3-methyladenine glycosylase II
VRVPGSFDGFELAVRAILGQQVSVAAATRLAGRLAERYGSRLRVTPWPGSSLCRCFPTPAALARIDPRSAGMPRARAAALVALANAVKRGELVLDGSRDLDASVRALVALPGIGEWTAQVIAMRALREPDAFPAGDLGLRRALGSAGRAASAARVRELAEAWRPWRAYVAALLWTGDEAAACREREPNHRAPVERRATRRPGLRSRSDASPRSIAT